MPSVLAFTITADTVEPECIEALNRQTVPVSWVVVRTPPEKHSDHYITNLYRNCAANREKARRIALATDADYFLSLDSDIVIPDNAVEQFLKQARPDNRVIGGWYKMVNSPRWVCGKWVADNTFLNFRRPEPSLVKTDMIGLGCAFIPRKALEAVPFRHGTDVESKAPNGQRLIVGECGAWGSDLIDAGFRQYMLGDVVCNHLRRGEK